MTKALTPEVLDLTQLYIEHEFSIERTAEVTGLTKQQVAEAIAHPQSKALINEIYLDTGYRNRARLGNLLDKMIESKIEEAEETEQWTEMDLAELIKLQHKMRMDEAKLDSPNTQVNIANFGDTNYSSLVERLMNGTNRKGD